MAKDRENGPGRSQLWLGLRNLTQREGVHRKDLKALLAADLRQLAEYWGIDVGNEGVARGKLSEKLSERIAKINPVRPAHRELDPVQHVAQFRLVANVSFNVESTFDFSTWSLTRRQGWISALRSKKGFKGYEEIWNFAISPSAAQRDLRDAITQLEKIILSEGYAEDLEPQSSAVTEADGDTQDSKESSAAADGTSEAVAASCASREEEATVQKDSIAKQHLQVIRGSLLDEAPIGDVPERQSEVTPASLGYPKNLTAEDISFDVKLPPFEDYFIAFEADSSLDDLMLKAQTFASRREAQAGMAERFGLDDEPHDAYYDPRTTTEQVTHGIHCAREGGGFGARQQRKAAVSLAGLPTGYRGLIDLHRTVYGIAGKDLVGASKLFSEVGKAARRVRRYDLAVEHKTHMFLYRETCDQGDLQPAAAQLGYVEVIQSLEPWRFVSAPLYCVINLVNALSIELLRLNNIVETSSNPEKERKAREESGRLAALTERIFAFSAGAPAAVTSVLRDELVEITGEVRATIKARVLEPRYTDVILHDDGQGGVIFMANAGYDEATRRGYLEQVRLHRMRANLGGGDITVDLDE